MKIKKLDVAKEKIVNLGDKLKVKTEKELNTYADFIFDMYDAAVDLVDVKKKKK